MILKNFVSGLWDQVRASFAPASCVNCELIIKTEGLCPECCKQIKPVMDTVVAGAKRTTVPVLAVGAYEGPLANLVYQKYKNNKFAFSGAAELIYEHQLKFIKADILLPIPLHKQKAKERGFDQVELIVKSLSLLAKIPVANVLKRVKNTKSQTNLSRLERQQNVAGAFELTNPEVLTGKNVVIVDDVYTTGATVYEVIEAIKLANPASIKVLVIARAV